MVAADALDVAATMLAEHFDNDDDLVARIGVEITCAGGCALAAISALRAQQPSMPTGWPA
jgi:hypothetical protein